MSLWSVRAGNDDGHQARKRASMRALPVCRLVWFADERLGRTRCARCCDDKRWALVGTKGLARRSFLNSIPVIPG